MNLPKTLDYKTGKSRVAWTVVYLGGLEALALGQPQGTSAESNLPTCLSLLPLLSSVPTTDTISITYFLNIWSPLQPTDPLYSS